ncbi:cupin domain-containing protein [Haemophilus parahaemolyticus]
MKKALLASLLSVGITSIAQADIGVVKDGFGKIMQTEQFTVVKKALKKGEQLKRHNHEGNSVIFTVLSGKMNVVLNDSEKHEINMGQVLNFDGKYFIQGESAEDSIIMVTLVENRDASNEHHYEHKH